MSRRLSVAVLPLLVACSAGPEKLAVELGLDVYLDKARPIAEEEDLDGDVTFTFDTADGPMCLRGASYRMSIRDNGSQDLVIFLQGGGACWSGFCLAVTTAPAGIPRVDLLSLFHPQNPVREWNVAYLPYCDGSLFAGDRDHDDDGDGTPDRFHRGLHNLSAALSVARERFPSPRRVLLAGSSGGGFGTLLAAPLVRHVYPKAELFVMNDSGAGVAKGEDPTFLQSLMDEFNVARFIPADCESCTEEGHLTRLVDWYLERDPKVRIGVFSSWYDAIIAEVFLKVAPTRFRDDLATHTGRTRAAFPDRYKRFIVDGPVHTALLGDPTGIVGSDLGSVELPDDFLDRLGTVQLGSLNDTKIGEVTMADWVGAMVRNESGWVDLVEEPGPPAK